MINSLKLTIALLVLKIVKKKRRGIDADILSMKTALKNAATK